MYSLTPRLYRSIVGRYCYSDTILFHKIRLVDGTSRCNDGDERQSERRGPAHASGLGVGRLGQARAGRRRPAPRAAAPGPHGPDGPARAGRLHWRGRERRAIRERRARSCAARAAACGRLSPHRSPTDETLRWQETLRRQSPRARTPSRAAWRPIVYTITSHGAPAPYGHCAALTSKRLVCAARLHTRMCCVRSPAQAPRPPPSTRISLLSSGRRLLRRSAGLRSAHPPWAGRQRPLR